MVSRESLMDSMSNDGIIFGMQVVVGEALGAMTEQEQSPKDLQKINQVNDFVLDNGQKLGDVAVGNQLYDSGGIMLNNNTICKPAGV